MSLPESASAVQEHVAGVLQSIDRQPITAIISVPAPHAPLSTFLRAVPRDTTFLWHPQEGDPVACAAAGVARRIDLVGTDRFSQMRAGLGELWCRVRAFPYLDCVPLQPRIFGGIAFAPGMGGPPWDEFSDGCFVLPRWTYERDADGALSHLSLAANGDKDCGAMRHHKLLEELDDILEALQAYEGQSTSRTIRMFPRIPETAVRQIDYGTWRDHVERIRAAITTANYGKIVAARSAVVNLPEPLDDIDVLTRLSIEPECTRFAIRGATSTFLGASPEVLFVKRGLRLGTQALAGTIRSLGSDLPVLSKRSFELLTSRKDLAEHDFVVRQIHDSLRPYCTVIDTAPEPQISKIRTIMHLNTPIVGTLRADVDAPALLEALHPTPAVGGVPKREAMEWIAANESFPRGWYTGAVGWVDMGGDAQFVVAIRCGLITATKAFIFTGAGIVADSDPASEYAETELKQLPLLRALGVVL
jgi:menaquinone-specific isochorismate synthase